MSHGSRYGGEGPCEEACAPIGIGTFVREDGGYTTVAVAVALLMSLVLVFATATIGWSVARAADVQTVADAAALSGSNAVAAYSTIAQVLDACVLSMGLLGVVVFAVGLIMAAVPLLAGASPPVIDAGKKILAARRDFAKSAAEGLRRLEAALPAIVSANSASTVAANARLGVSYSGLAVAFPTESQSDFSSLADDLDPAEMEQAAEELRRASEEKREAAERARAARDRAWRADNIDDPLCMRSRAQTLAGLTAGLNPYYATPESWRFDYARIRACNYYLTRMREEAPVTGSAAELTRSCARARFYSYAYQKICAATCIEADVVSIDLPELPHSRDTVRATELYTERIWPCTIEGSRRVLHCSSSCPGATGASSAYASLSDVDHGGAERCDVCQMDALAMGNVANASTNIDNGFEHYWRIVVEASRDDQQAKAEEAQAEERMREAAEKSGSAFERVMAYLSAPRPKLCPPGAHGCIAFVMRANPSAPPSSLVGSFLESGEIPAGAAVSAATLAPDDATDSHNVLSSVFDGISSETGELLPGALDGICGLWGDLLVGYGSAYGNVKESMGNFIDGAENVLGEKTGQWLRDKILGTISAAGIEPADMRLRKPVLTNSQYILDKNGGSKIAEVRAFISTLPDDPGEVVDACLSKLGEELGEVDVTVAEIPVPGLEGTSIPLTINLGDLMGAVA